MAETLEAKRAQIECEIISTWVCIGCGGAEPQVTFKNCSLMGTGAVGGLGALPICDTCWLKRE